MDRNNLSIIKNDTFIGLSKLYVLDLGFNKIHTIYPKSFQHCPHLIHLILKFNRLLTIRKDTFYGISNLQYLHLNNNKIQEIDAKSFQHLPELNALVLCDNEMSHVDPDTFYGLTKLKTLIMDNNFIQTFNLSISLKYLEVLYLHNNRLHYVTKNSFSHMQYLIQLSLDRNKLVTTENLVANKLDRLKYLWLQYNHFKIVSIKDFSTFPNLIRLDLSNNLITTLNMKDIYNSHIYLKQLYLSNNPITCNCQFLKNMENITLLKLKIHGGKCFKPAHLTNVSINSLVLNKRCKNNATGIICKLQNQTDYSCKCRRYFGGKYCEKYNNTCHLEQCNNHGQCDKNNTEHCLCNYGYTGKQCDKRISPCVDNLCQNNAICSEINAIAYNCTCTGSYIGHFLSGFNIVLQFYFLQQ